MRVLVATTAGEGHFGPMVPFAKALVAAGHDVRVAAPGSFAPTVSRAGLLHVPFADAPPAELGAVFSVLPTLPRPKANELVIREVFGRIDTRAALPAMRSIVAEWQPDLILREPAELSSYLVAQELTVPHVQIAIGLAKLDAFIAGLVDEPMREFGCDIGADGIRSATRLTTVPAVFDTLPAIGSGPTHRYRFGGDRVAAPPLPRWWKDDTDPLVYVSFGSVVASLEPFRGLYGEVISALAELPFRVLLTVSEAGDPQSLAPRPPNVHVEKWWPQNDVMPHASAVVGHGGFGTTMHALAAGVPQVVLPLMSSDQFENAARISEVGAGVVLEGGSAAVPSLAAALRQVLDNDSYASASRSIADAMDALPPPSTAVGIVEQVAVS